MPRKLASVQRIHSIQPIEGADRIEQAMVQGWNVVVKKNEFEHASLVVFAEIDSVLPNDAEWAKFMEPRKFRVKTCKLRGVLSQGLALPMSILPEGSGPFEVGDDVSAVLGIRLDKCFDMDIECD